MSSRRDNDLMVFLIIGGALVLIAVVVFALRFVFGVGSASSFTYSLF